MFTIPRTGLAALLLSVAAPLGAESAAAPQPAAAPEPDAGTPSLEQIRAFAAVYRAVKAAYVEPVDDERLMHDAIRGLLAGLDPHSEYLDISGLSNLDEEASGQYGGLGVEVLFIDGALRVIAPIDDTPASRAGIKPGDIILRIDGKPVVAVESGGSADLLRGRPGSEIALTIEREGENAPLELKLKREVIRVASVRLRQLEPGYVYVRITQFQDHTGAELREKLRRHGARHTVRGLVLDLRSNPGGLLSAAVEVSDAFLDSGAIVSTRGRLFDAAGNYEATPGDLIGGAPVVLLVDAGTASAAEIVAGALKDHRRGLVIGQRTFGKGSVQTVLPLESGDAVKLTTARYFTPSGVSIQAAGIRPDIELKPLRLVPQDRAAAPVFGERDLPGHLSGELEHAAEAVVVRDAALDDDYELSEALNVLKGLALSRERGTTKPAQPAQG
jgi:carboxyl-terminal processing protease